MKILIVEDEEGIRELLSAALEEAGYEAVSAGNVEEALSAALRWRSQLALVITDLVMPGLSGAVLERLLSEELPSVPVILMSGYFGHPAFERIHARDRLAFLQKPFDIEELVQRVNLTLGR